MFGIPGNPEAFEDAWAIARRVKTSAGGLRTFRRHFPDLSKEDTKFIWDRVWDRASRVKYMEDSNQGSFISKAKLGCPDGGDVLRYTIRVVFTDDGGNQHEHHVHVMADIEKRIGATNDNAYDAMRRLIRDQYFERRTLEFVQSHITSISIRNIQCFASETNR